MITGAGRALLCSLVLAACGNSSPPVVNVSTLPSGVVARVGSESVSALTVARIAEGRGVTPRDAVASATTDALFAAAARERLATSLGWQVERAGLGRALLEQLMREAEQAGAPTEAEMADVVRERWLELARPEAVRTTHVVVTNDKPERDAAARILAEKLALALQRVLSGDELISVANAFDAQGFTLKAEALPFVTTDARTFVRKDAAFVVQPGSFDPDFAKAANALQTVGELSPVVKSKFGYHVIRLEERAPGLTVSAAELPRVVGPEVLKRRAAGKRRELVTRLAKATVVDVVRSADDLTSRIRVQASP